MARLCRDNSRSYPGRAAWCPGQWRATAIDYERAQAALTAGQQSAEVIVARCPGGRVKDRTGRTRRRDDRLDEDRPEHGNGFAATGHCPSLEREYSRSHFPLLPEPPRADPQARWCGG